jgi:hypothetical protein
MLSMCKKVPMHALKFAGAHSACTFTDFQILVFKCNEHALKICLGMLSMC